MEPIRNFQQLLEYVKSKEKKVLAIASAESDEVIKAVKQATDENLISSILIGEAKKIESLTKEIGLSSKHFEIVDLKDPQETSAKAVDLVKEKRADMLMKGKVDTATLLKAVLDKEKGLRAGKLLSHVAVVEMNTYPKFLFVTDGGMNILPDVSKKIDILKNAVEVAQKLGIEIPKVSLLSASELVNPDMPETIDAAIISKMAERGELKNVIVDGPVAFDIAIDEESANIKGIKSPIAGDTDIFLVPNISSGNILVKGLIYLANAKVGGIVVGGGVPIVLLSRSDTAETKLYSMTLGAAVS